jgi:hypothetical protein
MLSTSSLFSNLSIYLEFTWVKQRFLVICLLNFGSSTSLFVFIWLLVLTLLFVFDIYFYINSPFRISESILFSEEINFFYSRSIGLREIIGVNVYLLLLLN